MAIGVDIVDISEVGDHMAHSLLNVGMAKARALLSLVAHEQARNSIDARIRTALDTGR